jgi:hypothetical protein
VLLKLADSKYAVRPVAIYVIHNFDKLPETIRNELLFKLTKNKDAARMIRMAMAYFNIMMKLLENIRNEIRFGMLERE